MILGERSATPTMTRSTMSPRKTELPEFEAAEPLESEDAADAPSRDSEVDFDDETEEDQSPLDVVEAIEAGVLFDDPEVLSGAGEDA
jgi:hypothetical protein